MDSMLLALTLIHCSRGKQMSEMSLRMLAQLLSTVLLLRNYINVNRPPSTPAPSDSILILYVFAIIHCLNKKTEHFNGVMLARQHCWESILRYWVPNSAWLEAVIFLYEWLVRNFNIFTLQNILHLWTRLHRSHKYHRTLAQHHRHIEFLWSIFL